MTDTIYTPHEMLEMLGCWLASRRATYAALCAELVEAESGADWDRAQRISIARDLCVLDISTLFDALNAP